MKRGARLNRKVVAAILKTEDGGKRAAAQAIAANIPPDALVGIDVYITDREVVGIVVAADKQAKNGVATKAASAVGITQGRP